MGVDASIEVLGADYGVHPQILRLNPAFRRGAETIRLEVKVSLRRGGEPAIPANLEHDLEEQLAAMCPTLHRHQCRGPEEYHLHGANAEGDREQGGDGHGVEHELMVAHLVEHVMIDAVSYITAAPMISGITGARRDHKNRFDIFVECPDRTVADLAARLGPAWVGELLRGARPRDASVPTLELARRFYSEQPRELSPDATAKELKKDPHEVLEAMEELVRQGFLCRSSYTVNFSGGPLYRFCKNGRGAPAARKEDAGGAPPPVIH